MVFPVQSHRTADPRSSAARDRPHADRCPDAGRRGRSRARRRVKGSGGSRRPCRDPWVAARPRPGSTPLTLQSTWAPRDDYKSDSEVCTVATFFQTTRDRFLQPRFFPAQSNTPFRLSGPSCDRSRGRAARPLLPVTVRPYLGFPTHTSTLSSRHAGPRSRRL